MLGSADDEPRPLSARAQAVRILPQQAIGVRYASQRHCRGLETSTTSCSQRFAAMSDAELVAAVTAEVAEAMDLAIAPEASLVTRWDRALPQYEVGHLDLVDRLGLHPY